MKCEIHFPIVPLAAEEKQTPIFVQFFNEVDCCLTRGVGSVEAPILPAGLTRRISALCMFHALRRHRPAGDDFLTGQKPLAGQQLPKTRHRTPTIPFELKIESKRWRQFKW
jgi:hypothetical protein